ncbi:aminotransferase class I/II-fold pyridoxal phosphate-dependent enzyme [Kineococcus esterisolvens]|uniref:aminotransferase class I/II-fold pyridoxal phosphate-dependent enzyme n=1 Tax=unclassified Kineococcus TaxID=2621656 RepID=UPI003D7CC252
MTTLASPAASAGLLAVRAAAVRAVERFGTGSPGVRAPAGSVPLHEELERPVARYAGREAAVVFSSGDAANTGVVGAVCGPGDAVFVDELDHASIVDGCKLSGADVVRFRRNDPGHLEERRLATRCTGVRLVVVDSVYSMDGDVAPPRRTARGLRPPRRAAHGRRGPRSRHHRRHRRRHRGALRRPRRSGGPPPRRAGAHRLAGVRVDGTPRREQPRRRAQLLRGDQPGQHQPPCSASVPGSCASGTCRACATGPSSGPTPSRRRPAGPTPSPWGPAPSATATSGCSTAPSRS